VQGVGDPMVPAARPGATPTKGADVTDRIEELMARNVTEVFDERAEGRRRQAIESIYAEGAGVHAVEGSSRGWDAVDAVVRTVQAEAVGLSFSIVVPPTVVADLGRLGWALGPADGPPVVTGTDVAIVRDGRIAELYTFIDLPA